MRRELPLAGAATGTPTVRPTVLPGPMVLVKVVLSSSMTRSVEGPSVALK